MGTSLLAPIDGTVAGCDIDWRAPDPFGSPACLGKLLICFTATLGIPGSWILEVNFAGRGYSAYNNLACGYSADSYVTFIWGRGQAEIDVWKALRDGVWTSSTTILCRTATAGAYSGTIGVGREKYNAFNALPDADPDYVSKAVSSNAATCATTLRATVTVNDDGTFSIA